jgi:hypothetical protein
MVNVSGMIKQLVKERDRLNAAIAVLQSINGVVPRSSGKRTFSAAARARMAVAQRARWAKFKAKKR